MKIIYQNVALFVGIEIESNMLPEKAFMYASWLCVM